jgi:hypothetical protein
MCTKYAALIIILLLIIILVLYSCVPKSENMTALREAPLFLEPDDQYEPLSKNLFTESKKTVSTKKAENAYINSLPASANCPDKFDDCPKWANGGECTINPEYMLYNCAKSCQACALSDQEKENLTKIYNSRDPPVPVYHGEGYPGPLEYMYKLLRVSNPV